MIAIPTGLHEKLHAAPYSELRRELALEGRDDDWVSTGATAFYGPQDDGRGDCGEGYSCGGPIHLDGIGLHWT